MADEAYRIVIKCNCIYDNPDFRQKVEMNACGDETLKKEKDPRTDKGGAESCNRQVKL